MINCHNPSSPCLISDMAARMVVVVFFCIFFSLSIAEDDADILVKFKASLTNKEALSSWDIGTTSPCNNDTQNWLGLRCDKGKVSYVILDNMGLSGFLDIDTLSQLSSLRSFSIKNNSFDGPMPEIKKLAFLKSVFLSENRFVGEIKEDAFKGMTGLKKVYLGQNRFTGKVPKSLVKLPKLMEVSLEDNQFNGQIPGFRQKDLIMVNVANNRFEGSIPKRLEGMNSTFFAGNNDLCGKPLAPCKKRKNLSMVIGIVVASVIALSAIAAIVLYSRRKNLKTTSTARIEPDYNKPETLVEPRSPPDPKFEDGKLCFISTDPPQRFDLSDLLRASAEVLGSGNLGSSYKAMLLGGPAMVVKRLRHMNNVSKEEFYQHMKRIGALSHPNLLPLHAFYYRKDEKLLISDFVPNGSLASHLHGNLGPTQPGLDWPTRLNVIKGVAKGLAYLYKEFPNYTLPHGHLKSSNVLLDKDFEPLLSEYALVPMINKDHAQQFMASYRSPECTRTYCTTRKTDVWSFGVLILELLTGKFPVSNLKQMKGDSGDLASWVHSMVREEWTGEVFDKDMVRTRNGEGEMLKLLKIGMLCCEWEVEKRCSLVEAVGRIAEVKGVDEDLSSYTSDDMYSSREELSFSITG